MEPPVTPRRSRKRKPTQSDVVPEPVAVLPAHEVVAPVVRVADVPLRWAGLRSAAQDALAQRRTVLLCQRGDAPYLLLSDDRVGA